jgi:hypothetical protein
MKQKELKNMAKKIAKAELVIRDSNDPEAIKRAESEIMKLSGHVDRLEDMVIIDDLVQEILAKS